MFIRYEKYKPKNSEPPKPSVVVGPYGHCLGPGHEGKVISTQYGYSLRWQVV